MTMPEVINVKILHLQTCYIFSKVKDLRTQSCDPTPTSAFTTAIHSGVSSTASTTIVGKDFKL